MKLDLEVRTESSRKGLYRADALKRLARRVCEAESVNRPAELSLLFCDDPAIQDLNRRYRAKNEPTDVLSFSQLAEVGAAPGENRLLLGDIVISLETVERRHAPDRAAMREEVRLLFCHGLLHLLGYTHGTPVERRAMWAKQAKYLDEVAASARAKHRPRNQGEVLTGGR